MDFVKERLLLLLVALVLWCALHGDENFLLLDARTGNSLLELGEHLDERVSPYSTFKIALSLMGFDAGILKDENAPAWPYEERYLGAFEVWKATQTPLTWMRYSCVWYSKILASQLGLKQMQDYLRAFDYGNQNLSGGHTRAHLGSTLTISPREQVRFLHKFFRKELPVSELALSATRAILFKEELHGGWRLFGKAGLGSIENEDGHQGEMGWFVGWVERGEQCLIFATLIRDAQHLPSSGIERTKAHLREVGIGITHSEVVNSAPAKE